jgi:ferredoxin
MGRIVRIWIDEQICLAHGLCVGECPEVFSLQDTFSVAKIRPDAEQFYRTKDAEIRSAANCCPVDCIHIEESDG